MPSRKSAVPMRRSCSVRSWSTMAPNRSTRSARSVRADRPHGLGRRPGDLGGQRVGAGPRDRRRGGRTVRWPGPRRPSMRRPGGEQLEGPLAADRWRAASSEMPKPWWNPSRAKLAVNRLDGAATRKSAASARPSPPPMAAPWTAATSGSGPSTSRRGGGVEGGERVGFGSAGRSEVESGAEVASLRAQDDGPRPVGVGPVDGLDHAGQQRGVEVVGRRTVHLHLGHVAVVEADGHVAEAPSRRSSASRGHRVLLVGGRCPASPRRPPRPAPRRCARR